MLALFAHVFGDVFITVVDCSLNTQVVLKVESVLALKAALEEALVVVGVNQTVLNGALDARSVYVHESWLTFSALRGVESQLTIGDVSDWNTSSSDGQDEVSGAFGTPEFSFWSDSVVLTLENVVRGGSHLLVSVVGRGGTGNFVKRVVDGGESRITLLTAESSCL